LTSIAGFSELMAMGNIGKLNSKQAEYLGHVVSASGVLKTLIDDILDLATIDAGAMALDITPAPLQPAIDSCLAALGERMSQRRLQAEIALGEGAKVVRADQERLRQILYNLLSNAVAASPDGGRIGITSSRRGDALELAVADEGPVVAEAERGRLFGRFEQRSGDGPRRGSGLGLSIVKSLVELHGGTVDVENPQSGGARFVLRMPDQAGARAA
jgi:signal transduction histidine kinase